MSGYKKITGHVSRIFMKNFIKQILGVKRQKPIGNAKITEKILFYSEASVLKYHQNVSNSCCLSSLASDFHSIGYNRDFTALVNRV